MPSLVRLRFGPAQRRNDSLFSKKVVPDSISSRMPAAIATWCTGRLPHLRALNINGVPYIEGDRLMRTLITGGAGFIGSHLCERFLAENHDVVCVDNFITGNPANIEHLRDNPHFTFLRHNISQPLEVEGAIDNILHFASPASPVDYLRHPIPTLKVGSLGTH